MTMVHFVRRSKQLLSVREGEILAPELPGIGLDVDEEKLMRFRV